MLVLRLDLRLIREGGGGCGTEEGGDMGRDCGEGCGVRVVGEDGGWGVGDIGDGGDLGEMITHYH